MHLTQCTSNGLLPLLSSVLTVLQPWWLLRLPLEKVYNMKRQPEVLTVLGLVDPAAALPAASDGVEMGAIGLPW